MTISRNYDGAYVISDIIDGYRVKRVYYGYSRHEAIAKFREDTK